MRTTISTLIVSLLSANAVAAQHAMPAAPPATPEMPVTAKPAPTGSVARAQFTRAVQDREPVDNLNTVSSDINQIYFFTELANLAGSRITHRWERNGQVMAEVGYDVGADRWRVWSTKQLDPSWTGEWKVSVIDASGATLAAQTFSYSAATSPSAAPVPAKSN